MAGLCPADIALGQPAWQVPHAVRPQPASAPRAHQVSGRQDHAKSDCATIIRRLTRLLTVGALFGVLIRHA